MITSTPKLNIAIFLVVVANSLAAAVALAETGDSIGTSRILLPEIEGFTKVTAARRPDYHVAADLVTGCDPAMCAIYVTDEAFDRPDPGSIDDIGFAFSLFYSVTLLDESVSIDDERFARLKTAMAQGKDSLRMILSQAMLQTYSESNVHELGVQPAMLGPPKVEVADEFVENEFSGRLFATGSIIHMMPDGQTREDSQAAVFGSILAKDKVLLATIMGNKDDLPRAKQLFDELAFSIFSKNEKE